jgi:hypothetical protein
MSCTVVNNVITLFNPFSISYTPNASNPLNFIVSNFLMPFSIKPTGNLIIETFVVDGTTLYSVDRTSTSNSFTSTVGLISETSAQMENTTTYTNTTYLISMRPQD